MEDLNATSSFNGSTTLESNVYRVQSQNVTLEYLYSIAAPHSWEWFLIAAYIVTFIVGVFGNVLVCFAVWKNKDLRTVTNIFMVNLAVADFTVIVFCLPSVLIVDVTATWFLGRMFCKIHISLMTTSISVSVLTLCAISIERWYAICYPLRFHSTVRRARIIIVIIWTISVCIGIPEFIASTTVPYRNDTILITACYPAHWDDQTIVNFQICLMVGLYFLPLGLMAFTYSQISFVLGRGTFPGRVSTRIQRELQMMNDGILSHGNHNQTLENRKKAAKMLVVVVVVFALCLLPNHTLNITRYIGELDKMPYESKHILALIAHWATLFNSCINPVIYNFMSDTFRKSFKVAVMSCFRCRYSDPRWKRPLSYDMTITRTRSLSARRS